MDLGADGNAADGDVLTAIIVDVLFGFSVFDGGGFAFLEWSLWGYWKLDFRYWLSQELTAFLTPRIFWRRGNRVRGDFTQRLACSFDL